MFKLEIKGKKKIVFDIAGELILKSDSPIRSSVEPSGLQAVSVSVTQVWAEAWSYTNAP